MSILNIETNLPHPLNPNSQNLNSHQTYLDSALDLLLLSMLNHPNPIAVLVQPKTKKKHKMKQKTKREIFYATQTFGHG